MSKKKAVVISKDGVPYTLESLAERLRTTTNLEFLKRALLRLYGRQTDDEKNVGTTQYLNRVGFTAADAPYLTSIAEQLQRGRPLSEKQAAALRRILPKYKRQLLEIIKEHSRYHSNDLTLFS
jgi:hypothetical protein